MALSVSGEDQEWEENQLQHDTALVADSDEKLINLVRVWERSTLKVILGKINALKFSLSEEQELVRARLGSENWEEVNEFKNLRFMISVVSGL